MSSIINNTKPRWGIIVFGCIEIAIGASTLLLVLISVFLRQSAKPLEVLIFVLCASTISLSLGIGILRRSLHSYHLLLFFSSVIIFTKLLIFAKIISLNGALETTIPPMIKNIISMLYHGVVIVYFTQPAIKKEFGERRHVFFSLPLPFSKR